MSKDGPLRGPHCNVFVEFYALWVIVYFVTNYVFISYCLPASNQYLEAVGENARLVGFILIISAILVRPLFNPLRTISEDDWYHPITGKKQNDE